MTGTPWLDPKALGSIIGLRLTTERKEIVKALRGRNRDVAYVELPSNYGHDAFLIESGEQTEIVRGFLANTYKRQSAPSLGVA